MLYAVLGLKKYPPFETTHLTVTDRTFNNIYI